MSLPDETAADSGFDLDSAVNEIGSDLGFSSTPDDDDDDALRVDAGGTDEATDSKSLPVAVSDEGVIHVQGEDGQTLAYRQGAISLDQVKRLAMQSAYRGGLASDA